LEFWKVLDDDEELMNLVGICDVEETDYCRKAFDRFLEKYKK